jgi:Zn finger protein HypA/HybF involved in hydrogenase expression
MTPTMGIALAILIGGGLLLAYVRIERRVSQRRCSECGFRVSIDGPDEDCPRCGSLIRAV